MGRRSQDNQIDWDLIEREFRLGQSTIRQLAAAHKVQASGISRRAKREGWVQDKREAVKALSEAQLLVSNTRNCTANTTPTQADIEVAATVRTKVILAHRSDAQRARALTMRLLAELELQSGDLGLFKQISTALAAVPDGDVIPASVRAKAEDALQRAMSLGHRAGIMKGLAESLAKVVAIEREAFGIEPDKPDAPSNAEVHVVKDISTLRAKFDEVLARTAPTVMGTR